MSSQLQHFFKSCDPDAMRSVDREAFRDLCGRLNITNQDSDVIFQDLDRDRDGRISFADFSKGYSDFVETVESRVSKGVDKDCVRENGFSEDREEESSTTHHVWTALTTEAERVGKKHSHEGKLKWLLNELQASEQRHLVPYLESAVEELLGNLHQLQEEKRQLEESWLREKLEHERHLKRMEEELDSQVKEAEMRLRLKAQAEVEDERKSLQTKMEVEMDNLQAHLAMFEKVNTWLQTQPNDQQEMRLNELRSKFEEATLENRKLRLNLLDSQTSKALVSSECLQLRTMYEEKCREVKSERERYNEILQDHDHLARQINLMHEAHKRLLDSHDAIRSSIELSPIKNTKEILGGVSRGKRGSVIGDYLDLGMTTPGFLERFQENEIIRSDESGPLRRAKSMDITSTVPRRTKNSDRKTVRQSLNQSDSGVSTVRDSSELGENWDATPGILDEQDSGEEPDEKSGYSERQRPVSLPISDESLDSAITEERKRITQETSRKNEFEDRKIKSSVSQNSLLDAETFPRRKISDIKKQLGIEDSPSSWSRSWSSSTRKLPTSSDISSPECSPIRASIPPTPMPRISKISPVVSETTRNQQDTMSFDDEEEDKPNCNCISIEEVEFEPTGPAEQTFKVIFVGDAGVGKSSLALRISKGVFVRHMSSTLGVDFLMRTLRVDGRNVAVQLWDTAGQERFRSITKSYFRKADGVMLLYDCTCEQSFLNVRQWVEDVDVASFYLMMAGDTCSSGRKAASQRIPLMIVANKIDLREMSLQTGITCINTEQGERLAKDCDTTFMEASAKDGSNVLHALANLIRSMSTHQDLQLSASTMQLCDVRSKKSSGCCGK